GGGGGRGTCAAATHAPTPSRPGSSLQPLFPPTACLFTHPPFFLGLNQQGRHADLAAVAVDRHEREKRRARQLTTTGERFLGEDIDLHLERRGEDAGDARLQDDEVADLDRVQELQIVDGGRNEQRARVAVAGDGAGDVDEVHDRAAEDVAERVRVVRQHDLHHLGRRFGGGLGRQVHAASVVN